MAADAALLAVRLFRIVEGGGVLGDYVRCMALLASRVSILRIVKWPQPVLVAPVRLLHSVERPPVAAMARRTPELFDGMELKHILIGMTGKRRIVALGDTQVGLRQRHHHRNHQRIGGHVAGLAAVDQSDAAHIVDLRARWVNVDLTQLRVHALHAVLQAREIRGAQSGQIFFHVRIDRRLRVFGGFIDHAALCHQGRFLRHQRGEGGIQQIVIEGPWRDAAVAVGPVHGIRYRFRLVKLLEFRGSAAFIALRNLLQLIRQRAHLPARDLKRPRHGGALAVEHIDLRLDFPVFGERRRPRGIHRSLQFFVIRGSVEGLFLRSALRDLLAQIARV